VADAVERGREGLSSRQQGADGGVVAGGRRGGGSGGSGREGRGGGGGGAARGAEEGAGWTEQPGEAVLETSAAVSAAAVHGLDVELDY
jgi:hypothetical protein